MNYWWVNQTDNWRDEFETGYLYSGESPHRYRKSILDVRRGDLVLCSHGKGEKREIYAIGIIADDPSGQVVTRRRTRSVQPLNKDEWPRGWEVQIDYVLLERPVHWPPIRRRLQPTHEAEHFTKASPGVQGYLFPVPPETAVEILRLANVEQPPSTRFAIPGPDPKAFVTAVAAEIMRRIGHDKWSNSVKRMWDDRCCATGFGIKRLLRASHIIPWSENVEVRLDPCNGLCLSPAFDAAFDAHLISFRDDGSILLAPDFSEESARQIGIDPATRINGLTSKHIAYLRQHRARCSRGSKSSR
jgi:hypothetical protein